MDHVNEEEMSFEELRAVMQAGVPAEINPGPPPVLSVYAGTPRLVLHVTSATGVGVRAAEPTSSIGPVRLVQRPTPTVRLPRLGLAI